MVVTESRRLLAVVYDDGIAADKMLSDFGYDLRAQGVGVQGLVQRNTFRRDRAKCDMELEELGTGQIFQLSKDRGRHAGGCRLDREAIVAAAAVMATGLEIDCDLLIINKFGRSEAEGRGLRDIIGDAACRGIPTIVGVPRRNLEVWRCFTGELAEHCELNDLRHIRSWLNNCLPTHFDFASAATLSNAEVSKAAN
jgi:nucleoside-triphosphatase THEP1